MKPISISQAKDKLKPERVVFVIAYNRANKRPSGMVAGWSTFCSSEPWMYLVCLWKEGYTHKLIQDAKEFVVAIPNKRLEKAIDIFGVKHGNMVNKFELTKVKTAKAKYVQVPLLSDATINFECKVVQEVDVGDHIVFIGKIVAVYANENEKVLINMGRKDGKRIFKEF